MYLYFYLCVYVRCRADPAGPPAALGQPHGRGAKLLLYIYIYEYMNI